MVGNVTSGIRLQIFDGKSNTRVVRVFTHLPVRIGRNPLNDLQIPEGFVSQFHAVLELHGDVLMLRDLGSRNGTRMGEGRAPAHDPVDLRLSRGEFAIGSLAFSVELTEVAPPPARRPISAPPDFDDEPTSRTAILQAPLAVTQVLSFDPAFDQARAKLGHRIIPREEPDEPDDGPDSVVERTMVLAPEAAPKPRVMGGDTLPHMAPGAKPPLEQTMRERQLEAMALQGVRELAQFYLPGSPRIETPEDVARFLSRVRDTLDVFLRCFVPLRDGYRQFTSSMDIRKSSAPRAVLGIESAQDERELAQYLLDPADEEGVSQRAVEGTFADLMIHQLALLNAIMRGVKSLLQELSPASVEAALGALSKEGKAGFTWGPWRFKALWAVYGAKYGDVDDGDKRTFAALFGRDFAEAYSEYRGPEGD
jgi:type VI secretion system protein ImpI